ncbi:MAG: hypothetical protein RLZZ262_795 [Bacteroidota bacterium]
MAGSPPHCVIISAIGVHGLAPHQTVGIIVVTGSYLALQMHNAQVVKVYFFSTSIGDVGVRITARLHGQGLGLVFLQHIAFGYPQ